MSFDLTPERLQGIAVKCAAQFMSKQASLSEAISKEAQALQLNPEQIKRSIEATNTITYLRQLEDAGDRTKEFPLADYKEVMAFMVLPEKQASDKEDDKDDKKEKDEKKDKDDKGDSKSSDKKDDKNPFAKKDDDDKDDDKDDKDDKEEESEKTASLFSQQEKVAMLARETLRCVQVMEKIAGDKLGLQMELEAAAAKVGKDKLAFEKLSHIVAEENLGMLVLLTGIEKTSSDDNVFTNRDLLDVNHLNDLFIQAKSLITKEAEIKTFLEKSAGLFSGGVPGMVGTAIGASIRGLTGMATAPVKNVARDISTFRAGSKALGMSAKAGAKHFDSIASTKGTMAAKAAFGGVAPGLVARKGLGGAALHVADKVGIAATGMAATHHVGVWDTLQKNN
jgi:hypothetical protein